MTHIHNNLDDRALLLLPDGTRADRLRLMPLRKELQRLGIPGVRGGMSKPELLDLYEAVFSSALKTVPRHHGGPRPLSELVARQTAALVVQQMVAANAGGGTANGPPAQPIASTR